MNKKKVTKKNQTSEQPLKDMAFLAEKLDLFLVKSGALE